MSGSFLDLVKASDTIVQEVLLKKNYLRCQRCLMETFDFALISTLPTGENWRQM